MLSSIGLQKSKRLSNEVAVSQSYRGRVEMLGSPAASAKA